MLKGSDKLKWNEFILKVHVGRVIRTGKGNENDT